MAVPSMQDLVKERKYPFILAFFILLMGVTFLLISNSQSPIYIPSTNDIASDTLKTGSDPVTEQPTSSTTTPSSQPLPTSDTVVITYPSPPPPPQPRNDERVPINDSITRNTSGVIVDFEWKLCDVNGAVDYIPCLDNWNAIKALKSRRHMEHRERHCLKPTPRCLIPLPHGYKLPVPWPKSRDTIWYNNVPHPKLVEYKKVQHWVVKSGDYFVFPGGGTQFKNGVDQYVEAIGKMECCSIITQLVATNGILISKVNA